MLHRLSFFPPSDALFIYFFIKGCLVLSFSLLPLLAPFSYFPPCPVFSPLSFRPCSFSSLFPPLFFLLSLSALSLPAAFLFPATFFSFSLPAFSPLFAVVFFFLFSGFGFFIKLGFSFRYFCHATKVAQKS